MAISSCWMFSRISRARAAIVQVWWIELSCWLALLILQHG
jgi:hypothetical protein